MKGLKGILIKDIGLAKNQILIVLVIIAIYTIGFSFGKNMEYIAGFAGSYSVVVMSMLPVTLLSYDEKNKWGRYSAAMPVSRKANVVSKYIIMLGLSLLNAAIMGTVYYMTGLSDMIMFVIAILGASLFIGSIVTVLAYKFGSNNARYIFIGVFIVAFLSAAGSVEGLGEFAQKVFSVSRQGLLAALVIFLVFSILVSLACMMASIHIYQNRDF